MLLNIVLDICITYGILYTAQKKALLASIWAAAATLGASLNVVEYTTDHSLIIAAILGSFIGCYVSIKFVDK
jgi:hypothetical protein